METNKEVRERVELVKSLLDSFVADGGKSFILLNKIETQLTNIKSKVIEKDNVGFITEWAHENG